jgi:hypothetical protein
VCVSSLKILLIEITFNVIVFPIILEIRKHIMHNHIPCAQFKRGSKKSVLRSFWCQKIEEIQRNWWNNEIIIFEI